MKNKIELYLISGFLGAGKTTFLKKMLSSLEGRKVGVLINEFGSVGIDGKTIERNGLSLVEINNGSIFCSCLKTTFVKTLIAFNQEDIDVLLIENSGFADPIGMHNLLVGIGKLLKRGYDYRGSVCLVDATSFLDHVDVLVAVENQVLSSNFIVLNKADLATDEERCAVAAKLREINPNAMIVEAVQADVPLDMLSMALRDNGIDGDTTNCPEARPAGYTVLTRMGTYDPAEVMAFLKAMAHQALRIKGFVKTVDGLLFVDAVGAQISISTVDRKVIHVEPSSMVLVFLGAGTTPFKDALKAAWKEHLKDSPIFMK